MISQNDVYKLKILAEKIRLLTLEAISHLGVGHVGGSFSIAEVLAVLYGKQLNHRPDDPDWPDRDWVVVSKGHAGPAVYAALSLSGFFPASELLTLNQGGTNFPSHCDRLKTPGIDMTTGSLGQGASLAAGVAKASQLFQKNNRIYLILGDGELNEGQVWEMALFAAHHRLSNLVAFVDDNGLQLDGKTSDICNLGDIAEKFRAFGWYACSADGHDVADVDRAIDVTKTITDRPAVIVLKTIKGKGWSDSEDKCASHNMPVTPLQFKDAKNEIIGRIEQLEVLLEM